jgi:hypothetical protein
MPGNSFAHDRMPASKMPGSRVICAIGFPLVSRVQHTLAFTISGRGHLDFCMIGVLRCQNISYTFNTPQNWGNLMRGRFHFLGRKEEARQASACQGKDEMSKAGAMKRIVCSSLGEKR